ncbi:MAG: hypothetical protein U1E50_12235 [Caulobacteraceae bacterium]|mgnify:CR=1 FL=1
MGRTESLRIGVTGVVMALIALASTGCGRPEPAGPEPAPPAPEAVASKAATSASAAAAAGLSAAELGRVCRAAVAAINGRDPSIIRIVRSEEGMAYTEYARPDDGKIWKNRCRTDGDRVIWSTVDLDGPGTGPGRWRNDPADEIIRFKIDGRAVTISQDFGDGSVISNTYALP